MQADVAAGSVQERPPITTKQIEGMPTPLSPSLNHHSFATVQSSRTTRPHAPLPPQSPLSVGAATGRRDLDHGRSGIAKLAFLKVSCLIALTSAIIGALVGATLQANEESLEHWWEHWWRGETVEQVKLHIPEAYDAQTSGIEGYLIDLEGTMYTPGGLVPGAVQFLTWMRDNNKPYVFLSNTGSKTSEHVQDKFALEYRISREKVPLDHIWTAAEAQMDMMTDPEQGLPENAHVFILSGFRGGDGYNSKQWLDDMIDRNDTLVNTWTIRTAMSMEEAQQWGARGAKGEIKVFVVMFLDGQLSPIDPLSPNTKSPHYEKDWSFNLMGKVGAILITGNGKLIYPANDPFNPSKGWLDPANPDDSAQHLYPTPGPGMMASLFRSLMHPMDGSRILCAGKGGDLGKKFMMEKAIRLLKKQGHSGDKAKIAIIGDRFDTDIRGGISIGIKTVHVETGIHSHNVQSFYSDAPATWIVSTVRDLVPGVWPKRLRRFSYHGLGDAGSQWPDLFARRGSPRAEVV